ncbi:MAG: glycosyltransferase family 4 protein [Sphingobium sp.]|jgi:glycosyltransferase involved in cell wall biosynthesis|nr:glycosyltransferase family 4 protein [Sphingobium sp.]MCI1270931.1 glycosyltransferase family 4 protein [Sphingobium sp.]MCI1757312.1 glycosyltransferase family 4 protein [Sphingobium sp.]MCI2053516.1 glycosyltransferase family 4 protein [Sphingobium sp.]
MRLLQLCTRFPPGGIQRHVIDLTLGLRARGNDVWIAGTRGAWMSEEIDPRFHHIDVHNVAGEGGSTPRRLWTAFRSGLALRKVLKAERIQLVHAHESAPALVAWVATRGLRVISSQMNPSGGSEITHKKRIPVFVTFHGAEPERISEFGKIARLCADLIITPSHNSARDLMTQGGVPESMVKVMGLGVQQKPRPPAEDVKKLRAELLDTEGKALIVTVARLAHQKAIDHLILAAKQALKVNPALRFVVVGDGPQREQAQHWLAEAGVSDAVRFIGHSDNAPLYMAAADLFFLPSRWESLPITIVEAFQQATPVLATDTAGVTELVDESVGAVVPIGDIEAMAAHLIALTSDRERLAALSEAALARAGHERFSPPHVQAAFEGLYAEWLGRK